MIGPRSTQNQSRNNLPGNRSRSHVPTPKNNRLTSPTPSFTQSAVQNTRYRPVPGVTYLKNSPVRLQQGNDGVSYQGNPKDDITFRMQQLFERALQSQEIQAALTDINIQDINYEEFQQAIELIFASKAQRRAAESEEVKQTHSQVSLKTLAENRMVRLIVHDSDSDPHQRYDFVYAVLQCLNSSSIFRRALERLNDSECFKRIFYTESWKIALREYINEIKRRDQSLIDAGKFFQLMIDGATELRELFWISSKLEGKCINPSCGRVNSINSQNSVLSLTVQDRIDITIEQILQRNREIYANCEFCDLRVLFLANYFNPLPRILAIKLSGQLRYFSRHRGKVGLKPILIWNRTNYNLISICCHRAESPESACYYSICKYSEKWYRYVNGKETEISSRDVMNNTDSYIIFYERQD